MLFWRDFVFVYIGIVVALPCFRSFRFAKGKYQGGTGASALCTLVRLSFIFLYFAQKASTGGNRMLATSEVDF